MNVRRQFGSALLVAAGLLAAWEAVSLVSRAPHYLLPTPWEVMRAGGASAPGSPRPPGSPGGKRRARPPAAPCLAASAASVTARWRGLGRSLLPAATLAQTVPILAVAPLILLWVGSGARAVTIIAALIAFCPIPVNTTRGLLDVPRQWVDLFATRAASPAQTLWKLRWPHALPALFAGLRIAAGLSVVGAITGELFAGSARAGLGGLGYALSYANAQMQTDYLFALVAVSSALGLGFHGAVVACEHACVGHWHPPR